MATDAEISLFIDTFNARRRKMQRWYGAIDQVVALIPDRKRQLAVNGHFRGILKRIGLAHQFPDARIMPVPRADGSDQAPILIMPQVQNDIKTSMLNVEKHVLAFTVPGSNPLIVLPMSRPSTAYEKVLLLDHEVRHSEDILENPQSYIETDKDAKAMHEWQAFASGTSLLKLIEGEGLDEYIADHAERLWTSKGRLSEEEIKDFPADTVVAHFSQRPQGFLRSQLHFAVTANILERFVEPPEHQKHQLYVGSQYSIHSDL